MQLTKNRGITGRRARTAAIAAVAAVGLASAGAASATAAPLGISETKTADGSQTIDGHLSSDTLEFQINAKKTKAGKVTGSFRANGALAKAIAIGDVMPVDLRGPVTCLDAKAGEASFYYPVDKSSSPSFYNALGLGILITVHSDKNGLGHFGFTPLPDAIGSKLPCSHVGLTPFRVSTGSLQIGTPAG